MPASHNLYQIQAQVLLESPHWHFMKGRVDP